jgi:hypothetical protein
LSLFPAELDKFKPLYSSGLLTLPEEPSILENGLQVVGQPTSIFEWFPEIFGIFSLFVVVIGLFLLRKK